jgi:5-methylcytosine-specific restriction protein A
MSDMSEEDVKPGLITTRAVMMKVFGGGPMGGIVPSKTTPNVLIYSDPTAGEQYGYIDGWLPTDDERGPIFEYTGHGDSDQTFVGRHGTGNRAILRHVDDGRALRVFKAVGKVPGSDTKRQRYIGAFELDADQPYTVRQKPNIKGEMRRVIVFRLRPKGPHERLAGDTIPAAEETVAIPVPADVTTSALVEPEINKKTRSTRSAAPKTQAERREAKLSDDFQEFMSAQGHPMKRFQLRIKGTASTLLTDLYDTVAHVLYELKGSSTREAVRMAIGQLFDYRRHVDPQNPAVAVLLPEEPHDDLKDLLDSAGVILVYWDGTTFIGVPGLNTGSSHIGAA